MFPLMNITNIISIIGPICIILGMINAMFFIVKCTIDEEHNYSNAILGFFFIGIAIFLKFVIPIISSETATNIDITNLLPSISVSKIMFLSILIIASIIIFLFCKMSDLQDSSEKETLQILCIKQNRFTKKKKLKTKSLDISHLSYETQKKIRTKLEPYFQKISDLESEYSNCKEELYSYGPYFDTLYEDLKQAIQTTNHDYEETILLDKIDYSCELLKQIQSSLKKIKKNFLNEQKILKEQEKEMELESHKEDFATTKELTKLLMNG